MWLAADSKITKQGAEYLWLSTLRSGRGQGAMPAHAACCARP